MCLGKQVLPLPFSFVSLHKTNLETSLLFYFHNCSVSDIVFWMPVLETKCITDTKIRYLLVLL